MYGNGAVYGSFVMSKTLVYCNDKAADWAMAVAEELALQDVSVVAYFPSTESDDSDDWTQYAPKRGESIAGIPFPLGRCTIEEAMDEELSDSNHEVIVIYERALDYGDEVSIPWRTDVINGHDKSAWRVVHMITGREPSRKSFDLANIAP